MPAVYFQTFGCQMNVADSSALSLALAACGYSLASTPESADLIVVNTCSVRQRAEDRARARIAEFAAIKRRRRARLWVVGCMAERLQEKLREEIPGIDAVIGARRLEDADAVVRSLLGKGGGFSPDSAPVPGVGEFVPVTRGCDNYCAYCIVPYVRGPEHSLPAETIEADIRARVDRGAREVTLLGQNVNSYGDRGTDFPNLLRRIAEIDGLQRIRFTTSHPKDCGEKLLQTIAGTPKICRHLHLPVQAGADRILSLMNRRYTVSHYRALLERIGTLLPDADVTTDLLVGFPGETEAEFGETLRLVKDARFTTAFMFAYSPREGTAAAGFPDSVPHEEKQSRLRRLIDLQTAITRERYGEFVGRPLEVLVHERVTTRDGPMLRGMDRGCRRILLSCSGEPAGTILQARAVRSTGMTLIAERI